MNIVLQIPIEKRKQRHDEITIRKNQFRTNLVSSNTLDTSIVKTTSCLLKDKIKSQLVVLWADSVSRSADLRTSTGSLVRPVVKFAPDIGPPSSLGAENVVDKNKQVEAID